MDADTLDLRAFTRVARLGSFAAAARELRLSTTAISRRVAALEDRLGTRLLHRTTRRVSLTPAGAKALERTERLLVDLEELHDAVVGDGTPRGHCRVTAGVSLGHALLHEGLPDFLRQHPMVSVEVVLTDRHVDLVTERIDLAVRIGALADSELVAMRLGSVGHVVCASPAWLADHGPVAVGTLEGISRIVDTNQPRAWVLSGPDAASVEVEAAGRYAVNSAHAARDGCRAGIGLAMLPSFVAREELANGRLVDALPGWRGPELGLYAVVLERRWISPAVRALVEHVRALVSP
ncbi:MAG: LysR family transcriptional regulator [Myxococcota bacterium]